MFHKILSEVLKFQYWYIKMVPKKHIIVFFAFTVVFSSVWVCAQDPHDYFGQAEADYDEYYDDDTSVLNNDTNNDIALNDSEKNGLRNVLNKYKPEFNDKLHSLQNGMDAIAHILKDISGKLGCEDRGLCNPPFKKILSGECLYLNAGKRKTWQDARETCQSMDADLAEPVGIRQDLNYIMRLSGSTMIRMGNDRLWLGASDQDKEGIWRWVSGSPVADDINWTINQPRDITDREDCMAMIYKQNPGVYAQNCFTRNYFVCQKHI